ncbi:hypothetical protein MKW98_004371 [Papaver atlanticum]|uniref:Vesicle transport protein n=1 Tax=Papaver atlanticum TaxID=357466 RepID=A0AAD4XGP9_9MAGN|nr:hypothetical protein MKW98_004371 [Papaver atlanticum]
MIVIVRPIKFAVLFTFGNILAVGSTAFLIGPAQQLRMMFDPVRVCATTIYIGSVILALIFALGRETTTCALSHMLESRILLYIKGNNKPYAKQYQGYSGEFEYFDEHRSGKNVV